MEQQPNLPRQEKSMFASNTAEVLNFEHRSENNDLLKLTLTIHTKLKHIAKSEYKEKPKYKIAKLTSDQLSKIKNLEQSINQCLIAFDTEVGLKNEKQKILKKVNALLDMYLSLSTSKEKSNLNEEFNELFQQ